MEAFSLLKYWRGGGGRVGGVETSTTNTNASNDDRVQTVETGNDTMITAVAHTSAVIDEEEGDEGPFFDLEFTLTETAVDSEVDGREEQNQNLDGGSSEPNSEDDEDENADDESDGDRELNVTLSSSSSNGRVDPNLSFSPADDLFFKGKLVPTDHSSMALNSSEPNSKHQFHVSLMKSATKFRVFMLGLKKQKNHSITEKTENRNGSFSAGPKQQKIPSSEPSKEPEHQHAHQHQNKLFTVKFKAEEVPVMSLFARDSSSRAAAGSRSSKQTTEEQMSDEKSFSKDVMHKYLMKVKPLYVRVSRKYSDKMRFSGQLSFNSATTTKTGSGQPQLTTVQKSCPEKPTAENSTPLEADADSETPAIHVKSQKLGHFPTGLKVVCKHLGKSRSASSVASCVPSGPTLSSRRDDSLLQQQDGIQSAILHCKRPAIASGECESSPLPSSASDSLH